jgi:GT2 family glycosyltransferase
MSPETGPAQSPPAVSVIVLGHGPEPHLDACVRSVLASVDDDGDPLDLELIVVENGAREAVAALPADPRIIRVEPGTNLGFAGGCNAGTQRARGRVFVFVNSDAAVAPTAIGALTRPLEDPGIGMVTGSVRLAEQPGLMNTAGNPVHYLGFSWAGGFRDPQQRHSHAGDVTSVSGAFFAVRRDSWIELSGFDEQFFAYHEDVDLSLRTWQRGMKVRYEASAVAHHHYEFSRTRRKQFLVERNRWITVLTVFPARILPAVLPAMLAVEIPLCALALKQGWLPDKLRGYWWLLVHSRYLRRRRARVQVMNCLSASEFADLLATRIEPAMLDQPPGLSLLNAGLRLYWAFVRRLPGLPTQAPKPIEARPQPGP